MAGYVQIRGEELIFDRRVEGLSDAAHRLYMMSFFSQQRSMIGLFRWTPGDMIPRAHGWTWESAEAALKEVVEAGLVAYDAEARLLFNPRVAEHHPIRGYKQAKGAATLLAELPDSPLLIPILEQVLPELETALEAKSKSDKDYSRVVEAVKELKARLDRLAELGPDTPLEGASDESTAEDKAGQKPDAPTEPPPSPHDGGMDTGIHRGIEGALIGVSIGVSKGHGGGTPTGGVPDQGGPIYGPPLSPLDGGMDTPMDGVSGGYPSRARERAPATNSNSNSIPKSKETPLTPLAPDGQPSGQGDDTPKRQGRVSEYAKLG